MADESSESNPFEKEKPGTSAAPGGSGALAVRLALSAAVVGIGAAGGYGLGGLFHRPAPAAAADPNAAAAEGPAAGAEPPRSGAGGDQYAYIDFDPITVNLNEPRLARYVRATIVLAVSERSAGEATAAVTRKKKELHNWLTVYLAGRTLEDVRGPKGLNRIRREIQDAFNEQLWPNRAPLIDHVLFKEFAIQ